MNLFHQESRLCRTSLSLCSGNAKSSNLVNLPNRTSLSVTKTLIRGAMQNIYLIFFSLSSRCLFPRALSGHRDCWSCAILPCSLDQSSIPHGWKKDLAGMERIFCRGLQCGLLSQLYEIWQTQSAEASILRSQKAGFFIPRTRILPHVIPLRDDILGICFCKNSPLLFQKTYVLADTARISIIFSTMWRTKKT